VALERAVARQTGRPFLVLAFAASSLSQTFGTSLNFFSKSVDSSDAIA
jgi:hypothetical protein